MADDAQPHDSPPLVDLRTFRAPTLALVISATAAVALEIWGNTLAKGESEGQYVALFLMYWAGFGIGALFAGFSKTAAVALGFLILAVGGPVAFATASAGVFSLVLALAGIGVCAAAQTVPPVYRVRVG